MSSDATKETIQLSHQEEEKEEEKEKQDEEDVRILLTNDLQKLSHQERCKIQDEIHGVKSIGMPTEQENTRTALKDFKEHLDRTLLLAQQSERKEEEEEEAKASDVIDSPPNTSLDASTVAFEICLKQNYIYATEYDASLRLMCLRADLWNPQKACARFLSYLNMLYKHYGEDGLKQSLTLAHLDQDTTSSSPSQVNSKTTKKKTTRTFARRGRKKSPIGTQGMIWLRSGGIQLLPSRDRSGRRVVIFELGSTTQDDYQYQQQQTQLQQAHAMFKAMLYFFSTIARCDADAQRDGLVLILSSNKTSSENDCENQQTLQKQFLEFYQAIPIRFCVVHACYDTDSDTVLSKMQTSTLQSFGNEFTTRVRFHCKDAGDSETQKDLATHGIPIHELPVTPTGRIKYKQHIQWIKTQAWFELQHKRNQQRKDEFLSVQKQHQEQMTLHLLQHQKQMALYLLQHQKQQKQEIITDFKFAGMDVDDFMLLYPNHRRQQQHHHHQQMSLPQSLRPSTFPPLPPPPLDQCQQQRSEEKKVTDIINCNISFNNISIKINSNKFGFGFGFETIECPRVNDVLFQQGGKYWNGTNKFQRGNNEFMELLATKIPAYRHLGSWKKKQAIITSLIAEFKKSVKGGRFLENTTHLNGVDAPDGCWIELPSDSPILKQKITTTIRNNIHRLGYRKPNFKKRRKQPSTSPSTKPSNNNNNNNKSLLSCDGSKSPKKAKKMNGVATMKLSPPSYSPITTLTSCSNSNNNNNDDDDDRQGVLKNVHIIVASNHEQLVQEILDKDEQLKKEVVERFDSDSLLEFSFDEGEGENAVAVVHI